MEYDLIRLWLGMISDMGNAALGRILDYFGGPEELWNVPEHVLRETLTEKQSERILCTRDEKKIIVYKNRLKERNITYIYPGHPYFPEVLREIPDCPFLLYAKGCVEMLKTDRTGIAIVGARRHPHMGKRWRSSLLLCLQDIGLVLSADLQQESTAPPSVRQSM